MFYSSVTIRSTTVDFTNSNSLYSWFSMLGNHTVLISTTSTCIPQPSAMVRPAWHILVLQLTNRSSVTVRSMNEHIWQIILGGRWAKSKRLSAGSYPKEKSEIEAIRHIRFTVVERSRNDLRTALECWRRKLHPAADLYKTNKLINL